MPQTVQATLVLLMLFFNPMIAKTFGILHCVPVGDAYYVAQSMQVRVVACMLLRRLQLAVLHADECGC